MTVTHGMNVAEVDGLGQRLQMGADRLVAICAELDSVVRGSTWAGPDADRFSFEWWPAHKARLLSASERLHGFGQSALNNAGEQRVASGEGGAGLGFGASGAAPLLQGSSPFLQGSSQHLQGSTPPSQSGPASTVGAPQGELPDSHRTWQDVQAAYEGRAAELGVPADYRAPATGESGYQCTGWAVYRWRELGFDGEFGRNAEGKMGDGFQMATNNGGSTSTPPALGAMASYESRSFGHVMIVEEVMAGGTEIRVSEMNTDPSDPLMGRPEEYRSDRVFTRQANGTWVSNGRNYGPISFASLPN